MRSSSLPESAQRERPAVGERARGEALPDRDVAVAVRVEPVGEPVDIGLAEELEARRPVAEGEPE